MGLLDGSLQAVFGAAFAPLYLPGTLHRQTRTDADDGDVTVTWADSPIRYQPDKVTEAMRSADGYTERDAAFLILQAGVPIFNTDAELTAKQAPAEPERRWAVKSCESDPAGTHWVVRASPTQAPPEAGESPDDDS
ncbi:hypothetical protein [Caulobacter hibisci]|uniref:Uncharacterized protein n=1 Tax=Caulobacter hibisci TaxID=2035993 RepID=A0ABS0SS39_9CAUL|nr:hypothetical protein [Caulobacter hibisci]MBI1682383.1 hypothetical protein [Caulobacter hibisci]